MGNVGDKWMDLLKSRRFWAAVAGLSAIVGHELLGLPEDSVREIVLIVAVFIVGDSVRKIEEKKPS